MDEGAFYEGDAERLAVMGLAILQVQLARLAEVRRALGGGGAAERTAEIAIEMMDGSARA